MSDLGASCQNVSVSVPDSTAVVPSFAGPVRDDGGFFNIGTPTRLTVPVGGDGWYVVSVAVRWSANNSGVRVLILDVSGTDLTYDYYISGAAGSDPGQTSSLAWYLAAGDFVGLSLFQSSGSTLTASATLSLAR